MERHKREASIVQSSAANATELGAGSAAKGWPVRQALGPEFCPRHPCKNGCGGTPRTSVPVLRDQRQAGLPTVSLA